MFGSIKDIFNKSKLGGLLLKEIDMEWISVKDRLPEFGFEKLILQRCESHKFHVIIGFFEYYLDEIFFCKTNWNPSVFKRCINRTETHWCEIPERPDENKL